MYSKAEWAKTIAPTQGKTKRRHLIRPFNIHFCSIVVRYINYNVEYDVQRFQYKKVKVSNNTVHEA